MSAVLIVTQKFDPHADRVIEALRKRDVSFFRLNTDDFHDEIRVSAANDDGSIRLADCWGREHRYPEDTRSVWYRKPIDPAPPGGDFDAEARSIILRETVEFLSYPGSLREARWINYPFDNMRARRKFPQLQLAREIGLRAPRTLVTNDVAKASTFHRAIGGDLICKSMAAQSFSSEDGEHFIFSRRVGVGEFEAFAGEIRNCPTLLQEYVPKDHELRITIFGEKAFCCRIDSQSVTGAESDWRRVDPFTLPHIMVDLDRDVEAGLKRMMSHYDLRYAAFDMIVTPGGEYIFLEMNPNGQWLWMELITGAPMAEAMADLLAD